MREFMALVGSVVSLSCGGLAHSDEPEPVEPAVGCIAFDEDRAASVNVPGQERRIDGSVWQDGAFNDPAAKTAFCAEHAQLPEAWFCRGASRYGDPLLCE